MTAAGERLIAAAKEMRTMAKIPEDIIKAGRRCYDGLGRGSVSDSEHIARAILAAEKRGEERERERLANMLDPEIGLPSDRLLRVIHADVETRGRKNNKFAVTVHHRSIVLSAVAAAIRKGPDK